ncbi:Ovochymase-2 [Amphibalanus amphitrite]|uniref:Ovochymase-2 n=1 Tax=Amphibalanus amphitrite TaxID=1232801 RepID=A0A6A4VRJ3_AMPAM|nr:trypsin-1-like [Amphibalanus amphitrite]KAF0296303.1 Ovochymase-2 [Amphibalanus amphitrite]
MRAAALLTLAACAVTVRGQSDSNTTMTECGQQQVLSGRGRIVGGSGAYAGQLPWTVSIQLAGQHFCGGTLIGQRHVLSAAHCFHNRRTADFRVVAGEHDLRVAEPAQQELAVAALTVHDQYKYPSFRNDLALLTLAAPAVWGPFVQPACLPAAGAAPPTGRTATVAGWGWLAEYRDGGRRADRLQSADVPVQTRDTCNAWFAAAGKRLTLKPGQICAGLSEGGKDACQGDSGGPLVVAEPGGSHTLVGVVSAGIGCARPSLPGIYTDVSHYLKWIQLRLAEEQE